MTKQQTPCPNNSPWIEKNHRLTAKRKERLLKAVEGRTNFLHLIIQDVHNPHNVSACMRSAEAFGIQNVHIVCLKNGFKPSTVARGVADWLTIHIHDTIESCVEAVHQEGLKIIAGMPPSSTTKELQTLEITQKTALLFGNEHDGVSPDWTPYIDQFFTIPMVGLVESLNISVCAAITMFSTTLKAKESQGADYYLTDTQKLSLLDKWITDQYPNG